MNNGKHVNSLDSLRAIAAVTVLLGHIELIKAEKGLPNIASVPFFDNAGHYGVLLFFVISGYIITRLLLKEQHNTGKISIKNFYIRRVLRIWPLYFFVLLLSMAAFSYIPGWITGILCFTILSNVAHALGQGWTASPQIWSIGAEEQFYLFWPSLVKFIRKRLGITLVLIILGYTALSHFLNFFLDYFGWQSPGSSAFIDKFFYGTKFNLLAMGSLLAYCQMKDYSFLKWFSSPRLSLIFVILPFLYWFTGFRSPVLSDFILGILFTLLLAHVTVNRYFIFNNLILDYLGKISYGLYMYHWMVITLMVYLFTPLLNSRYLTGDILLYFSCIALTIMVSAASYHFMESYFLNLKKRFDTTKD